PWGYTEEEWERVCEEERRHWGEPGFVRQSIHPLVPSLDEENLQGLITMFRQGASRGAFDALNRMNKDIDVRSVLPTIRIPTLVLNRTEEPEGLREGCRLAARLIQGAGAHGGASGGTGASRRGAGLLDGQGSSR